MKSKYLIFGILAGIILLFIYAKPLQATPNRDFSVCQDFVYKFNINVVPATIDFYTEGKLFKTVPTQENYVTTVLHCGKIYQVKYSAENYETLTKDLIVGPSMPINYGIDTINLIKLGGSE